MSRVRSGVASLADSSSESHSLCLPIFFRHDLEPVCKHRLFSLIRSIGGSFAVPFKVLMPKKDTRYYLAINFMSRRYSKQSSLSLIKIMNSVSLNVFFGIGFY